MDAIAKKSSLVDQLMIYYNNDQTRLVQLGDALRMLGIDSNDEATLNRIAENPAHFTQIITYTDLGLLQKLKESVDVLKGTT